jgi:PAS domain S-box-containing protein
MPYRAPTPVPPRALVLSLAALAVPILAAFVFPESLADYGTILWLLALVPAFLLAYYRGWQGVSVALGVGMAVLTATQLTGLAFGTGSRDWVLLLLVVAAYISIALGIGWLTELLGDATVRRRQENLRRQLDKALDVMQMGVTITDPQGVITYANVADARMHGFAVRELIGKDVGLYAPGGTRKPLSLQELQSLSSWKRETTNARKDGSTFPVELNSDVVFDVLGRPIAVVTTCHDISRRLRSEHELHSAYENLRKSHTDLQLAQLKLIEAEKLESVGRLAAGVAHEVKNPLMTLLTGVKFLAKRLAGGDPAVETLLEDMRDAVNRADTVIRGLLDFSAPRKLDRSPQDMNVIVARAVQMVKHELDRARVAPVLELHPTLPRLMLDPFKIQQVLINLITNATHATPAGGTVTVRTTVRPVTLVSTPPPGSAGAFETGESIVLLEIEDTGSGIPPDQLSKIFDPFFTTKPTGKGTGLGLSVTRQIVEMHGGTIQIENRPEGGARASLVFHPPSTEEDVHEPKESLAG